MASQLLQTVTDTLLPAKPRPVQVIAPSASKKNTYELNRHAFENSMWEGVEDLPVVVISIAGIFRTGKSFLLGYFIRYLEHIEGQKGTTDWMGDPHEPLDGFAWKYGWKKTTSGIWLWGKIFKVNTPKWGQVAVVLMDTEGTDDNTSTAAGNTTLFSLCMLLSSTIIYNVMRNLNRGFLENLEFCASYAKMIKEQEDSVKLQSSDAFQKILFLVRDWEFNDDTPYGLDNQGKFLHPWLLLDENAPGSINEMRANINTYIKDICSFRMPHPGDKVRTASFTGTTCDLSKEFKEHLCDLVAFLLSPDNIEPKVVNGRNITCKEFKILLKSYFWVCEGGKLPKVDSMYNLTAFVHNQKILNDLEGDYASAFRQEVKEKLNSQSGLDALEATHERLKQECLTKLTGGTAMGNNIEALHLQFSEMIDRFYGMCTGYCHRAQKEAKIREAARAHEAELEMALEKDMTQYSELELFPMHLRHPGFLRGKHMREYDELDDDILLMELENRGFRLGKYMTDYRELKAHIIASHMENQGVHLREAMKMELARDLAASRHIRWASCVACVLSVLVVAVCLL